jgi:hypothetical protein
VPTVSQHLTAVIVFPSLTDVRNRYHHPGFTGRRTETQKDKAVEEAGSCSDLLTPKPMLLLLFLRYGLSM